MSDREDFEEAAVRMGYSLRMRDPASEDGEHGDRKTQCAWDMWQECCDKSARAQQAGSGEAVAWQFFRDEKWHTGMNTNDHRKHTEATGIPTRDLYTHPSAELAAARDEAERLQGRVAALEEGLYGIANCAFGYSGCRQTVEEAAIWMNGEAMGLLEGSDGAWLLRKQAEAVEEQVRIGEKAF